MALLRWLDRQPATHFALDHLGGRRIADGILSRVPVKRQLEGSEVVYRHASTDTFMIADEIFGRRVYDVPGLAGIRTFADLGCNVGLFVAWVAHRTGRRNLRGIAVDANPRLVEEARWLVEANALAGIHAVHGLVGTPGGPVAQEFFVNPVSLRSSRFPNGSGRWQRIHVHAVDVETTWRERVGTDVRCDLLKMDIEGGEADFLREDNPFLARVDQIILEWHEWVISEPAVHERLAQLGFAKLAELSRGADTGIAHYHRTR